MTALTKPSNIAKVWADTGAKADPGDAKYALGWVAEIPTHENFNFLQNTISQGVAYINENGIGEWDANTNYALYSVCRASDGLVYYSLSADNTGNDPAGAGAAQWGAGVPGSGAVPMVVDNSGPDGNSSNVPLTVKGHDAQNAPIFQIQDSAGDLLAYVSNTGALLAESGIFAQAATAVLTPVFVKGKAGQTANLQNWQNSNGDNTLAVTASGAIADPQNSENFIFNKDPTAGGVNLSVEAYPGGLHSCAQFKGVAGQSASLVNWLRSDNLILAAVTNTGNIQGTGAYTDLSDVQTKHNIEDLGFDSIAAVTGLQPRKFIRDGELDIEYGFIAQEVATVLPAAVKPFGDSALLGIQAEQILAVLVDAVQRLIGANNDRH